MEKEGKIIKKEIIFHDEFASKIDIKKVMVDESFEASTCPENSLEKLGNLKGKKILDLGCGAGIWS